MTNKNYISGRNLEYSIRSHLRAKGYEVIRSAGSKSAIDLIAINGNEVLCIQAKKGKLTPQARNRIRIGLMKFRGYKMVEVLVLDSGFKKEI